MQKQLTPEDVLDILRAADSRRQWSSLDDQRICTRCMPQNWEKISGPWIVGASTKSMRESKTVDMPPGPPHYS